MLICTRRLERYEPGDEVLEGDRERWLANYPHYCQEMSDEEARAYRRKMAAEQAENIIILDDDPREPGPQHRGKHKEAQHSEESEG